jgi:hypothetical protein
MLTLTYSCPEDWNKMQPDVATESQVIVSEQDFKRLCEATKILIEKYVLK